MTKKRITFLDSVFLNSVSLVNELTENYLESFCYVLKKERVIE